METSNQRLLIRIGRRALAFALFDRDAENQIVYEPYALNDSMSMAANLREAFRQSALLGRGFQRAQVIVDSPSLLIPVNEFEEEQADQLYRHALGDGPDNSQTTVMHQVLPHLNAVVVYQLNNDLQLVVSDHIADASYHHLMQGVWHRHHACNFSTPHHKLYAYLHEKQLEVFCFDMNRFRFSNSFEVDGSSDAVYFLLAVWKQLAYDAQTDELHLFFDTAQASNAESKQERQTLVETLRGYVRKTHTPLAATVENAENMPYDLKILLEE